MSVVDGLRTPDVTRAAALLAIAVLLGAPLQVMYHFIDVVGFPVHFLGVVAVSLVAATALARVLGARSAVLVGTLLLVTGLGWYLTHLTRLTAA